MSGFEINGMDEFREKLKLVEKKAPDKIINKLNRLGGKLRSAAKENTPKLKPEGTRISESYKLHSVERGSDFYEKGMSNTAPHFHLVEHGHRKVTPGGREVGFVPGQFFLEKTIEEMKEPINSELKRWLNKLYNELK